MTTVHIMLDDAISQAKAVCETYNIIHTWRCDAATLSNP